ncbi:MAG: SRPBCC family protein [Nitrospirota bacterium]
MKTRLGDSSGSPSYRAPRRVSRVALWVGAAVLAVAAVAFIVGWFLPADYHIGAELVIPTPAERVWRGLVVPDRWSKWLPWIRTVIVTNDLRGGVGSRRRIVSVLPGGRELVSDVEVTEWTEGSRYAHRHLTDSLDGWTLPVSDGRVEVDLERVADHACRLRITASFRASGALARWWALVVAKPLAGRALNERLDEFSSRIQSATPET